MVGETGWQLSHGERGRSSRARRCSSSTRASWPSTLRRTLACAIERAGALIVIAHP
jgi:ATP-binding cassette subfamily B protein